MISSSFKILGLATKIIGEDSLECLLEHNAMKIICVDQIVVFQILQILMVFNRMNSVSPVLMMNNPIIWDQVDASQQMNALAKELAI